MNATMNEAGTVVGVFESAEDAREAIQRLKQVGFLESQIGVLSGEDESARQVQGPEVAKGALVGAAAGIGLGTLWGVGVLAGLLPGIGPAIAGGTLAVVLANAAAGAATASLAGMLIALGVPAEEAGYYEGEVAEGKTIVTVMTGQRMDCALAMMKHS